MPEASSSSDVVGSERHTSAVEAASRQAGHVDDGSVEAVAPSEPTDCERPLLTTATAPEISLHLTADDASTAVYTVPACGAVTSTLSAAATRVTDADGNVEKETSDAAPDTSLCTADAVASSSSSSTTDAVADVNVASCAVVSSGDAGLVSATDVASSDAPVTCHVTSQLSLSSAVAESVVSSAQTAATIVSTQATVGSPLVDSSHLTSFTPGIHSISLLAIFTA